MLHGSLRVAHNEQDVIEDDRSEESKGNEVCSEGGDKDEQRTEEEGGKVGAMQKIICQRIQDHGQRSLLINRETIVCRLADKGAVKHM